MFLFDFPLIGLITASISYHYAHVSQSEVCVELAVVEGTHILNSSKGGDSDGTTYWEDWKTVSEAPINPFLLKETHLKGLMRTYSNMP